MQTYFRAIPRTDPARPEGALTLAGGWCWFTEAEVLTRDAPSRIIPAAELPAAVLSALTSSRRPLVGIDFSRPKLMGILNVTPDSFSDGGLFAGADAAVAHAAAMTGAGADILDIGGESTRPGATPVPERDEIARTQPVIAALRRSLATPISIDTRKSAVARAALEAGADIVNDVAAFTYDPELMTLAAATNTPVCLMHAQGDPQTMQQDPRYDDVLLDVYDFLADRVAAAVDAGVPRHRIIVDPGIGFGKTQEHNLALLRRISLFHSLGCPVLLGASRKRFIGTIGQAPQAADRAPGSIAVALAAVSQGIQILRVHDMSETRQALSLHMAQAMGIDEGRVR